MTRDEVSALLPFYANGSLTGDERAEVEAALAGDAALREELAALRVMRATLQTEPVQSPGEFGLARLMRAVEAEAKVAPPVAATRSTVWRIAAALLFAAFAVQSLYLWQGPGGPAVTLAGDEVAGLTVAFAPDATEEAIRALLLAADLQVIAGPSAIGLWVLTGPDLAAAEAALAASPLVESVEAGG